MRRRIASTLFASLLLFACGQSTAPSTGTAPAPKSTTKFVGSSKSNVYHLLTCRNAKQINASNLITFDSREAAQKAGYRPCEVCKP